MTELLLGCETVEVIQPELPTVLVQTPTGSFTNVEEPSLEVEVSSPAIPDFVQVVPPAVPGAVVLTVPGPPGPPGPPGTGAVTDGVVASGTTTSTLSGHRVVVIDNGIIRYADPTTNTDAFKPMHLTMGSLSSGGTHNVLALGTITESSWSWSPGVRLYLGPGGVLTETAPVGTAFIRVVAFTRNATSIYFDPQTPVHVI